MKTKRSREVGISLASLAKDHRFESYLRHQQLRKMKLIVFSLIFFCIFTVQNKYNLNEFQTQKQHQTDRRGNESVPTSIRNSLCNLFCSDLSIYKTNIMQNKLQDQVSTDEKKLHLIKNLLAVAPPEQYIQSISDDFASSIISEMKDFKLTGKDVSSKIVVNQELVSFFYKLGSIIEKERLIYKLKNLENV